jgi:hypothetical protein
MKGTIFENTYTKNEKEKSRLRMGSGSWSIPLDWIEGKGVESICYITEKAKYEIDLQKALIAGWVRNMQGERKLIVPIKFWEITTL